MAIPVPHTFTAGDNATSSVMQTLTDSSLYLLGSATSTGDKKTLARLYQSVSTTSLADSTWTSIGFDAETFDYAAEHSTTGTPSPTSRLVAAKPGVLIVSGQIAYTGNSTGLRRSRLAVNGAEYAASAFELTGIGTAVATVPIPMQLVFLNTADYLEIQGWQSSGGALATSIGAAGGAGASHLNVLWVSN